MVPPLIRMKGVSKTYGGRGAAVRALDTIDLAIDSGEFVAIMGPSGSGKTTLMNLLGFLDRPTEGAYQFAGQDVGGFGHDKLAEYRNNHLGFVFQGYNLLSRATAAENVALPIIYRGVPRSERHRRALASLASVGLADRQRHRPQQLSGGEQQRVAIARAVIGEPLLVLADEPTGAIDSANGRDILTLFQRLNDAGRTVVLITHAPYVGEHAKRVISLRDGRIVGDNPSATPRRASQSAEFAQSVYHVTG